MTGTAGGASPVLRFDSTQMEPEQAFWLWREQFSPIFEICVPESKAVDDFHGMLETYHLGSLLLGRCTTVTQTFKRTPQVIARSGIDHYLVQLQNQGNSRGEMGVRKVAVATGDVCILDLAQTVHTVDRDVDCITLCLPREMLAPLVTEPDGLHGLVLCGQSGIGAVLAGHIRSLYRVAGSLSGREALTVAHGIAAFVAGCLGPTVDALDLVRPEIQASRMSAIKRYIDSRLADPQFGAAEIVQAFGLSRPTLYRMFEPMGGVAGYILQRRLTRSLADLLSARHHRVADIAHRWGFSSETAFSRAFRAAFGMAPRDARASLQKPNTPADDITETFKRWFHELAVL